MDVQNRIRKSWLYFLTAFLLCGTLLFLTLGTAYARFEATESEEIKLSYENKTDQVILQNAKVSNLSEDMEIPENTYVWEVVLSNGTDKENYCTYDQIAEILLFATSGLGNPDNYRITLIDGGNTYEAVYKAVVEGSTMQKLYGSGWIYRFYNEAGEELTWQLSGSRLIEKPLAIFIEGTSELPTALSLFSSSRPVQ